MSDTYTISLVATENEGWRYYVKGRKGVILHTSSGFLKSTEAEGHAHAWLRKYLAGKR